MTDEDRSPKFFALHVETSSKFIGGSDLLLAIILAANAFSCLLYGTAWLNLAIGILTLSAAILALVSLYFGFDKKESIYLIVPIIFQVLLLSS
jgi:heme/copper-type cytochrome/quinol oxidase subunit 4